MTDLVVLALAMLVSGAVGGLLAGLLGVGGGIIIVPVLDVALSTLHIDPATVLFAPYGAKLAHRMSKRRLSLVLFPGIGQAALGVGSEAHVGACFGVRTSVIQSLQFGPCGLHAQRQALSVDQVVFALLGLGALYRGIIERLGGPGHECNILRRNPK